MTVRSATATDKARAIELLRDSRAGAEFDSATGATGFTFPFDPAYAERLFLSYLHSPLRLCIVHDVNGAAQGILLADAYEHPFGPVLFAQERLWWIDPSYRGGTAAARMLDVYEKWAKEQGCKFVGMVGMGEEPAVGALYKRRGYRVAERNFLKAI